MVWIVRATAFAAKENLPKAIFSKALFLFTHARIITNSWCSYDLAYDLGIISEMSPMVIGSGFKMTQIVPIEIMGKITGAF